MGNATVNVVEFFAQRWKSYEQDVKAHEGRKAECGMAARNHVESIKRLRDELSKKEALKKQASENGLDTSPLDKDITRLRGEIDGLQTQHDEQLQLADQPGPKAPYDKQSVSRFVDHLAELKSGDAEVLHSLQDAAALVTVLPESLTLDDNGKVIKIRVQLAKHFIGEVAISPEHSRFAKSFRPKALEWLPGLNGERPRHENHWHSHEPMRSFIVEDKQLLLLPSEYEFSYRAWHGAQPQTATITGSEAPFILASNLLDNAVKEAGGVIRLDQAYQDSFLSRIREQVVELTSEQPRWVLNTEWPDSDKVFASIREDLSLVVSAPWSDSIHGSWAKMKYTLESGERPRVWHKEHVDHFGIRLRTRDHSWLIGSMYIDHAQQVGKSGSPIEETNDMHTRKIGRMHIRVIEFKDVRDV